MIWRGYIWMIAMCAAMLTSACGTVEPEDDERIVVEGFAVSSDPLPVITLRKSAPLRAEARSDRPEEDAAVSMLVNGTGVPYVHDSRGRYRPVVDQELTAGDRLELRVHRGSESARAQTLLPPPIRIESVSVDPAANPIEAVLIDTLDLSPGSGVTGYLYLIDVSVEWKAINGDDSTFVRIQLRPDTSFASLVIDLFLRSDEVVEERSLEQPTPQTRRWSGVYAVRVDSPNAPLPDHRLRVGLLRSGRDYARFALSRDAADRREPIGNVTGGLGIFAGIAVDSLFVPVYR